MQLHIRTSTELPAPGQAFGRREGRDDSKVPLWFLLPFMTQPTQKGTTKNKEFSEVTPEMGLSHQAHIVQGPLSHQTVMERLEVGYLLTAEGFLVPCSSLLGKLYLNKIFQEK